MKLAAFVASMVLVLAVAFTVGRAVGSVELLLRAEKAEKDRNEWRARAEMCVGSLVH